MVALQAFQDFSHLMQFGNNCHHSYHGQSPQKGLSLKGFPPFGRSPSVAFGTSGIFATTGNPHKRDSLASLGRLRYQWHLRYQGHLRHLMTAFLTDQRSAVTLTTGTSPQGLSLKGFPPFGRLPSVAWLRRHSCIPAHRIDFGTFCISRAQLLLEALFDTVSISISGSLKGHGTSL